MASTCISNCISDTRVPVRPTYVNLYKWPESDAEFVRSLSSHGCKSARSAVVDSISCRQMYLRSYTFHRNEHEKTKCFGRVDDKERNQNKPKKKRTPLRKAKEVSCAALLAVFRRLLSCTTKVDVADHGD
ncbi:hypothetical protein F3Y22_tig00111779pilonHSYRG00371 [Hibiscus syriacus]|uniref:Uncharacterized protein n=1 Tax=Hibiscus syriacus TaxID=106335 RepID=A0A6A2XEC3_HIBSY|nr:uncharacterized protein LOC120170288 [Hibiscus syriacus]KAE8673702.1 hypothetical protein F3Y22_tig00111779pilonHSYRG00371 [Hibiscus syriacus]